MRVQNENVKQALEKIEQYHKENKTGNCGFSFRTENTKPHLFKGYKYFLYCVVDGGLIHPDTYGALLRAFKTQKEFFKYVDELCK